MYFDPKVVKLVNELRVQIQRATVDIDAGESVGILLWWSFVQDHCMVHGYKPEDLAKEQLEAFLKLASEHFTLAHRDARIVKRKH